MVPAVTRDGGSRVLMLVVRLNNDIVRLVICTLSELKWMGPVVINVKCDLQPGRVAVCCVQGKVEYSAVVCVVLCCEVYMLCHSSVMNSISNCLFFSSDKNSLVLHDN
jgi:hypothetical protein